MHGFTKCDCVNKFFLTEGNKKILTHKEKSRFPFSATAHRDFEIFKKAVLDFCGVQSLAEAKGLGRSMDCSFMRTVRSGTVESFCIRTQRQWENEMALLLERDSILHGMLTMLTFVRTFIICLCIINYVRLLLAVGHSNNNGFCMHLRADRQSDVSYCRKTFE